MAAAPPSSPSADRNLLFGILAVQLDFLTPDALVRGMKAWVLRKHQPLAQVLVEQQFLDSDARALLEPLVDKQLTRHRGELAQSLAARCSVDTIGELLRQIADPEIQASLTTLGLPCPADTSALPRVDAAPRAPDGPRFRVLRPHAKGGLGQVSVALDQELNREVALKEIQEYHANRADSRARFLLEAEVTGGLEHPGIVPVYSLGHYADGRPYYAMRFIQGESLQQAIDAFHEADVPGRDPGEREVALRQLLGQFVDVCNAVAYAHSRGVLHRDLKPANVMLGAYGETLLVDWGLAKLLGHREEAAPNGERTLRPSAATGSPPTQGGQVMGTPAYMSPEQAAGRLDQLGPASDVYGLGAVLYSLLTGRAPYVGRTVDAVLRRVQEGDCLAPRAVKPNVPRALEAICRKAMALRTADRYPSAQALAGELESWLAGEPVGAWREPWAVRAQRWLGRHRTLVTGVAAALLVALTCLTAATALLKAANSRERAAKELAERHEREAINQRSRADANAHSASEQRQLALETLKEVVFNIQAELENRPGLQDLRKRLLEKAQDGLRRVGRSFESSAQADHSMAWACFDLGDLFILLGDTDRARVQYQDGHRIARALAEANLETTQARRDLAVSYCKVGDIGVRTGDLRAAKQAYADGLKIFRALAEVDPEITEVQRDLALTYENAGDVSLQLGETRTAQQAYADSLRIRRALAEAGPQDPKARRGLSLAYDKLGDVSVQLGDTPAAQQAYTDSLKIRGELAEAYPEDTEARRDLAVSYSKVGDVGMRLGDTRAAQRAYADSLKVFRALAEADPKNTHAQRDLAVSYRNVGDVCVRLGDMRAARQAFADSLKIRQALAEADPKNAQVQRDLSLVYHRVGDLSLRLGETHAAQQAYEASLKICRELAEADPQNTLSRGDLAASHEKYGDLNMRLGDTRAAQQAYEASLKIRQALAEANPKNAEAQRNLAVAYIKVGDISLHLGQSRSALQAYEASINNFESLAKADPQNVPAQTDLVFGYYKLGHLEQQELRHQEALRLFQQALTVMNQLQTEGKLQGQPLGAQRLKSLEAAVSQCQVALHAIDDLDFALAQPAESAMALLVTRATVLARRGRHAEAAATADKLHDLASKEGAQLYNAACCYSLCVPAVEVGKRPGDLTDQEKALQERYGARAIVVLRKAIQHGYRDVAHMKTDKDLDPLRARKDFQEFFHDLEESVAPAKATAPSRGPSTGAGSDSTPGCD